MSLARRHGVSERYWLPPGRFRRPVRASLRSHRPGASARASLQPASSGSAPPGTPQSRAAQAHGDPPQTTRAGYARPRSGAAPRQLLPAIISGDELNRYSTARATQSLRNEININKHVVTIEQSLYRYVMKSNKATRRKIRKREGRHPISVATAIPSMHPHCANCSRHFRPANSGRPGKYCSLLCRVTAFRAAKKALQFAEAIRKMPTARHAKKAIMRSIKKTHQGRKKARQNHLKVNHKGGK